MQNLRIINAQNGGFLVHEDREQDYYSVPIAALTNSGDLIRWMTEQFIKPKTKEDRIVEVEKDGFVTEWTAYGDHAVVKS